MRLNEQLKISSNAYFVTITYDNENISTSYEVDKQDVQLFIKRLRKATPQKIRYYLVAEYGSRTFRPHYHAIMFDVDDNLPKAAEMIRNAWGKGNVLVGSVTPASIHYTTKYVINKYETVGLDLKPPFALISKGLGKNYVERCTQFHDGNTERSYAVMEGGYKVPLPRYLKEKLYNQAERETMAQNALKRAKTPGERFPGERNPFKADSDAKEHFTRITNNTSKSKTY